MLLHKRCVPLEDILARTALCNNHDNNHKNKPVVRICPFKEKEQEVVGARRIAVQHG